MNNKNILLAVFVLLALVQLYIPAKMIIDRENVLASGVEYKFKTAPVDPNDPLRGKYITLAFEGNRIGIEEGVDFVRGETVYVLLENDDNGFVTIGSAVKDKPTNDSNYLKAEAAYATDIYIRNLTVNFPFDRYYMEESKAYEAELAYNESQRDTSQVTYALVVIKDGESVLKDVMINGVPISKIVADRQAD